MHIARTFRALTLGALALVAAVPAFAVTGTSGGSSLGNSNTASTNLQKAIEARIAARSAQGLAVPAAVTFHNDIQSGPPLLGPQGDASQSVTVIAKTTITFDGPEQAGRTEWPAVVVSGEVPAGGHGTIHPGDYSQLIRDQLAIRLPGIWDRYTFGHEPRTYTFTETFTSTHAALPPSPLTAGPVSAVDQFLMGFTIPGPGINYTLNWGFEVCVPLVGCETVVHFRAGFQLDWALGMRLPMELGFLSDSPYLEGSTYFPTSTAKGVDWSASDYTNHGAPAESGNEWVARLDFTVGVFLEVFGSNVVDLGVDVHPNKSASFVTPFGSGASFPIPPFDVPLWGEDYSVASLNIGFRLQPDLGSDKFTADWTASGEASGSGSLTYTDPTVPVTLNSVQAIDGPGTASFEIKDFQYFFSKFFLDLSLTVHLDVFSVVDETFVIPVTDFDLSGLTGGLHIGTHDGTAGSMFASVHIDNVPPTAVIDKSGASTINGILTFQGVANTPMSFSGNSKDPGRDDLTLSWDFGDGAPAPDVSTTYPVPHDVTDTQSHSFTESCVYTIGFKSVDDDAAFAEDHVNVLIFSDVRNRARLDGYWQEQMAGNGPDELGAGRLSCMLGMVGYLSTVFDEVRDASTPAKAYDVLHLATNGGSELQKLDRELLVTWLNLANGVFDYNELIDTNGDGTGDTPFSALLATAEAVRKNPASSSAALKAQTDLLHALNVSRVGKGQAQKVETRGTGSFTAYFAGFRVTPSQGRNFDISFALAQAGPARVDIFDISGRVVRSFEGAQDVGVHTLSWDGTRASGAPAGAGVYFIRGVFDQRISNARMILLR